MKNIIIVFHLKVWYVTGYDVTYQSTTSRSFIFGYDDADNWIYGPEYPLAVKHAFAIQVSMNGSFI